MTLTKEQLTHTFINEKQLFFLSDQFNKDDWKLISKYQTLSESFILRFKKQLYWPYICAYQHLSESFLENNDVKYWDVVLEFQQYSVELLKKINILGYEKLEQITTFDGSMSTSEKVQFALEIIRCNRKMSFIKKENIICSLTS